MNRSAELPPALRPWSDSLAFLSVEAALHLGPLVRRLDMLVRRHDAHDAHEGEPDGYGGLTTRGHPERLLLSEWLLAEEIPEEFIRRAAERELLHVEPAFRAPAPAGKVAVFCDVGPDQLGAARLVQLAALIVLHRCALARGSELLVGLSGESEWHGGELPEQFAAWRAAHTDAAPTRGELVDRRSVGGELWVLAGESLAAQASDMPLVALTREAAWDESGPTAVDVRFEGRTTRLTLPTGPISLRTLRGRALRRKDAPGFRVNVGSLAAPRFPGGDRRLLVRGDRPDELVGTNIPTNAGGGAARPRRYHFHGSVVAAMTVGGRRLIALVLRDGRLRCEVVGKYFADVADLDIDAAPLGLTASGYELAPLYFDRGELLSRLAGRWWRLPARGSPRPDDSVLAVGPGTHTDRPFVLSRINQRLVAADGMVLGAHLHAQRPELVAGHMRVAWSDGAIWSLRGLGFEAVDVEVGAEEKPLGVIVTGRTLRAQLVTVSASGTIVRVRAPAEAAVFTEGSGPAISRALHPRLPLLAVQREEDYIEVLDLTSGERLQEIRGE